MHIVIVTGGFDPIHSGHIEMFNAAKELGDYLVVGVNSDDWLKRKKGNYFMPIAERKNIINNLAMVDEVIEFDDSDDTARDAIKQCLANKHAETFTFANGGDRNKDNIPEMEVWHPRLSFEFGVGGTNKKNSSSWILKEWSQPTTQRAWGTYTVLEKGSGWQVKQLAFEPGKSLSDQRHFKRSEHWHVVKGKIQMRLSYENGHTEELVYSTGDSIDIPKNTWHLAKNVGNDTAQVIEVWLGSELTEDDIERR